MSEQYIPLIDIVFFLCFFVLAVFCAGTLNRTESSLALLSIKFTLVQRPSNSTNPSELHIQVKMHRLHGYVLNLLVLVQCNKFGK